MVQLKLGESKKVPLEPKETKETVVDLDNAERVPTAVPVGSYRIIRRTSPSQIGWFPIFSFFVILVSSFCLLKQVCNLKQENIFLRRQLELEAQKDAILKQVVMDAAVTEQMFLRTGYNMNKELNVIYSAPVKDPSNWLDINLSLLWTSPEITHCDMANVARMLFQEMYKHGQQIYELKEDEDLVEAEEVLGLYEEEQEEEEFERLITESAFTSEESHDEEDSSEEIVY